MKRIIILLLIAVSVTAIAFVSKPNPPTFEQDLDDLVTIATDGMLWIRTHEDSVLVAHNLKEKADEIFSKWDFMSRYATWPPSSPCLRNCGMQYLYCIHLDPDLEAGCNHNLFECARHCPSY